MHRPVLAALAAVAALVGAHGAALAQSSAPHPLAPLVPEPAPRAAGVYGATYIPGVGFRYVAPGGSRVYGYRAYGPRVDGYRRIYRDERCVWLWDDCFWRRRR